MAKIILLSRNMKHTTWPLAQSLRAQQHQVYLLTSRDAEIGDTTGLDVMTYFKKWSLYEAIRILPTLLAINPQVFHLVLEKDELSAAEIFLSYMAQSLPHCVVTTSLMDLENGVRKNRWLKSIVEKSDIVTFPSVETLGHLRGLNVQNKRQNRGLLPPLLNQIEPAPASAAPLGEMKTWLSEKPTLALPMFLDPNLTSEFNDSLLQKLALKYHLLFLGTWESWTVRSRKKMTGHLQKLGVQWTISETQNSHSSQRLLESCEGLWLAGLALSPTEYTQNLWNSWSSKVPLVIDSAQASMHSGLWKASINVHILKTQSWNQDLDKLLSKKTLKTPEVLTPQTTRDLMDHSTNDLNRLYNKALSEKAVS